MKTILSNTIYVLVQLLIKTGSWQQLHVVSAMILSLLSSMITLYSMQMTMNMKLFNKFFAVALGGLLVLSSCETAELDLTSNPNALSPNQADADFFLNNIFVGLNYNLKSWKTRPFLSCWGFIWKIIMLRNHIQHRTFW